LKPDLEMSRIDIACVVFNRFDYNISLSGFETS